MSLGFDFIYICFHQPQRVSLSLPDAEMQRQEEITLLFLMSPSLQGLPYRAVVLPCCWGRRDPAIAGKWFYSLIEVPAVQAAEVQHFSGFDVVTQEV